MKASTNLDTKDKKQLRMQGFLGVDMSSSSLDVAKTRATASTNLISEFGVNHKRQGWTEVWDAKKQTNHSTDAKVYSVTRTDDRIIIHAGSYLYAYTTEWGTPTGSNQIMSGVAERDTQAYTIGDTTYIIGSDHLIVYDTTNGFRAVGDGTNQERAYVPTTTISIDYDGIANDPRAVLDDINLLTDYRKNSLHVSLSASESKTYTLDGTIDQSNGSYVISATYNGTAMTQGTAAGNYQVTSSNQITIYGPISEIVSGADNVVVTFKHTTGNAGIIAGCRFGTTFGVNGNTDRLFLSGNTDRKNKVFYSEAEQYDYFPDTNITTCGNTAVNGFSRLSDSTMAVLKDQSYVEPTIFYMTGQMDTEYDDDGNVIEMQALFPVTAGGIGEASINYKAAANLNGDNLILTRNGVCGLEMGTNIATNARYAKDRSRNIGDDLKNRIGDDMVNMCAIVYKGKYYIASPFYEVCYVADPKYKFVATGEDSYNYEWWYWDNIPATCFATFDDLLYFGTASGKLCVFNTGSAAHKDITYEEGSVTLNETADTVTFSQAVKTGAKVVLSATGNHQYGLLLGSATWTQDTTDTSVWWVKLPRLAGSTTLPDYKYINRFYEGKVVRCQASSGGTMASLSVGTDYTVTSYDRDTGKFRLRSGTEYVTGNDGDTFDICYDLIGKDLYAMNVDDAGTTFGVKDTSADSYKYVVGSTSIEASIEPMDLVKYNNSMGSGVTAKVTNATDVEASWYTPCMDLGTTAYAKTLLGLSIATEPNTQGKVWVGYKTYSADSVFQAKGLNVFSIPDIDFTNFSFSTGFATSYSVQTYVRNFNFIIFRFVSYGSTDCCVNNLTITYKINTTNRGVR